MSYDKLTDREMDALVAQRLMGWHWRQRVNDTCIFLLPPTRSNKDDGSVPVGDMEDPRRAISEYDKQHAQWATGLPCYSTDDALARLVRNRIAELNLIYEYRRALASLIWPADTPHDQFEGPDEFAFRFEQATPRQQCEAALTALDSLALQTHPRVPESTRDVTEKASPKGDL